MVGKDTVNNSNKIWHVLIFFTRGQSKLAAIRATRYGMHYFLYSGTVNNSNKIWHVLIYFSWEQSTIATVNV